MMKVHITVPVFVVVEDMRPVGSSFCGTPLHLFAGALSQLAGTSVAKTGLVCALDLSNPHPG
jgi:hypothetical protein